MEISIILDNTLVKNYDFTRGVRNLGTLDNFICSDGTISINRKELRSLDKWAGKVKVNNPRLYTTLVCCIGLLNFSSNAFADITDAYARLDRGGYLALGILKKIGFWLCIICCFVEILKSFLNNDARDVWKIFFKYISVFLVLYSLPVVFRFIAELFE